MGGVATSAELTPAGFARAPGAAVVFVALDGLVTAVEVGGTGDGVEAVAPGGFTMGD
jgi:hypothetical protein